MEQTKVGVHTDRNGTSGKAEEAEDRVESPKSEVHKRAECSAQVDKLIFNGRKDTSH